MRVLLVEDEEATIRQICMHLEAEFRANIEVARSRDTALQILNSNEDFDLIVCDLRIPTLDNSLDANVEHGLRVHDVALDKHPGTFSVFFSGYAQLNNIGTRLSTGEALDVFGTGQSWSLVAEYPKSRQPEFFQWVGELKTTLDDLGKIKVVYSDTGLTNQFEERSLRIYANRLNGSQVVALMLGGLSEHVNKNETTLA